MSAFDSLRGTQQQLKDEFAGAFKRMTDPEEIEKAAMEKERNETLQALNEDAGL